MFTEFTVLYSVYSDLGEQSGVRRSGRSGTSAVTVLYLALTVLYLALTVLYLALTVLYADLGEQGGVRRGGRRGTRMAMQGSNCHNVGHDLALSLRSGSSYSRISRQKLTNLYKEINF